MSVSSYVTLMNVQIELHPPVRTILRVSKYNLTFIFPVGSIQYNRKNEPV
jgi:hypothetical protein